MEKIEGILNLIPNDRAASSHPMFTCTSRQRYASRETSVMRGEEEEEEDTASKSVADNEMGETRLNWQITSEFHSPLLSERMDNRPPRNHPKVFQLLLGLA